MRRGLLFILLIGIAMFTGIHAGARADDWPNRTVRVLVPYAAGGAVDILARTLGDELAKRWHQPVIIENHPGAGGTVASQTLVTSPPDGYTLIVVASGHAINPYLYSKLPYDTFTDFAPIALIATSANVLLVQANSPIKSLSDLLKTARQKPGSLSYAMAGNGTSTHLAGELLKYLAKVDIAAIPYKGGAPALTDLIGGHITMSLNNIPESIGQIKAGTVHPLGVTTAQRSPALPDVPTIAEAGVAGYDTGVWWGVLAPAGLPQDLIVKLNRDCIDALNAPAVKQHLIALGATPAGGSPEAFAALIRADYEKWGPIIKAAGIHGE